MIYVFDIDGTICTKAENFDYEKSKPLHERIEKVNQLYDDGHTIIFQTARGMGRSGNSVAYANTAFYKMTEEQLESWGVKYHQLVMGKAHYDILIDDKAINSEEIHNINDIEDFLR